MLLRRLFLFSIVGLPCMALAQTYDAGALDTDLQNQQQMLEIRQTLTGPSSATRSVLLRQLKDSLFYAQKSSSISRIALAIGAAADDETLQILSFKLPAQPSDSTISAICRSMRYVLAAQPAMQPSTVTRVREQMVQIAANERSSSDAVDSAVSTLGSMGAAGFDALLNLRAQTTSPKLMEVYFTAVVETGDNRALPLLRSALADPATTEGKQIQIISGIGRFFDAARRHGRALSANEQILCREAVRSFLHSASSSQLYEVALQALAQIDRQDAALLSTLAGALLADSSSRREAALQAIYTAELSVPPDTVQIVSQLAESDPDDNVRDVAQAVMSQFNINNHE